MSKVRDYDDANTWKWLLSGTEGGDPLQRCHLAGMMEYDELVLVRS